MTLSNLLMTAYVNKASEAGKGVWDILEEVARDHLTDELYKQAAGLFDPNTTIDTRTNEYQRGVVELILRFTGTEVDDIGDIASNISERTRPVKRNGVWEDLRTTHRVGELYTEYTEGGDYWGFTVTKTQQNRWYVASMGENIGWVRFEDNMFPTFFSYGSDGVLIDTHVGFAEAVRSVAATSAGLPKQ